MAERSFSQQMMMDISLMDAGAHNVLDFDGLLDDLLDGDLIDLPFPPDGDDAGVKNAPGPFSGQQQQQQQPAQAYQQGLLPQGGYVNAALSHNGMQPVAAADGHSDDFTGTAASAFQPSSSSGDLSADVRQTHRSGAAAWGEGPPLRTSTNGAGDQGVKKRRSRNAAQMEMNRVAQKNYRERKKAEQSQLQVAVDQLAAQLAAFKVLEVKASALEAANGALQMQAASATASAASLQQQVASKDAELASVRSDLATSQAMVTRQQSMILDQHAKLELQAQVIESLKEQLHCKIDSAMNCMEPGSVCDKLVAAVKAAIYGAKDQDALQAELDKLPAELTTQICKNIFCVVKEAFPELKAKCAALMGGQCPPCTVTA